MEIFVRHQLVKEDSGYILTLYLAPNLTEFSRELNYSEDISKDKRLYNSIEKYVNKNLKNVKINTVKIMVGTMLVASISFIDSTTTVRAATPSSMQISQTAEQVSIVIDGQKYNFSHSSVMSNGTTYIPIRDVAEVLGVELWWNDESKTVGINKGNTKISFIVGSNKVRVNDKLIEMQPSYIDNGTTMVPIRFISETLGMDVNWNQNSKTVTITSSATVYRVKAGDTLWKIANQFNTTISALRETNGISGDMIYVGQELKVKSTPQNKITPPPKSNSVSYISYKIQPGDNMWELSLKYGIPMAELLKTNNMTESSPLSVGQTVSIPVYNIAPKERVSERHGEYLDWWTEAQYLFSIGKVATVTDFQTGKSFQIKRTTGAFHADCEPLTTKDAAIIKEVWGGNYSWKERAVIVQIDGRKIAASMASMPHDVQHITDNNFNGHFDLHFKNSTRHKDGLVSTAHQTQIQIAAGLR